MATVIRPDDTGPFPPTAETSPPFPSQALQTSTSTPSSHQASSISRQPSLQSMISPGVKKRLKYIAVQAVKNVHEKKDRDAQRSSIHFWMVLFLTAMLSSLLSFTIDQAVWVGGNARHQFRIKEGFLGLVSVCLFNMTCVIVARLLVRTTIEAEGSGFPEVKAMLFGKVMLNYLTLRVLVVKAICLVLGLVAGLPLGKEGPNVHMAACISRTLGPRFYERGHGKNTVDGAHLLLAACAVGVGASFSAPIGGVVFALELVMPQIFDSISHMGCFLSAVVGSIWYALYRSWTAGANTGLEPMMSSNVSPSQGAMLGFPVASLVINILLGVVCGLLGGAWIKIHAKVVGSLKRWRLAQTAASTPGDKLGSSLQSNKRLSNILRRGSLHDSLLGATSNLRRPSSKTMEQLRKKAPEWRDLFQVAAVAALNTIIESQLPLLGGKPQPVLISTLFDKELHFQSNEAEWSLEPLGPRLTLFVCCLAKFVMTFLALSSPSPAGVVLPMMIIGGLIGRCFVMLLPESICEMLIGPDANEEERGAFLARFAIVGAAAFCSAVCRAFAMAITVFEVLTLPNAALPLFSSSFAAIFVANKIALPYFDTNLMGRGLGGISALTHTKKATQPVSSVMRRLNLERDCLEEFTTKDKIQKALIRCREDFFPIIQHVRQSYCDEGVTAVLRGSMSRDGVDQLLEDLDASPPETEVDLFSDAMVRPRDGSQPLVRGVPASVEPDTEIQAVYLMKKVTKEPVVYVTSENCLLGVVSFEELLGHSL